MPRSNISNTGPSGIGSGSGSGLSSGSALAAPSFAHPNRAAQPSSFFSLSFCLGLIALFAVSLGVQLLHHFVCDHPYVMFAFDGKHYLSTCQSMTTALQLLLQGKFNIFLATIAGAAFGKNLIWDGPIIPGIPALFFAAIKRTPTEADWSYFAVYFSLLASLSAVLVAVIARILSGRKSLAIAAGALFALYPTTLLATGVYRSEILGVTLMLAFLLALYKAPRSLGAAITAAVIGGIFAMVKPVMIPAIGLLCLITGLRTTNFSKAKLLLILAVSGILTIAPWSIYTALDCGKLAITAERGPSYNAGVGTDIGADGWCTLPETEHVATAKQNKSPLAVFIKEWRENPLPLAKLTLRRISRLWGNPWNDFREPIFGLPMAVQLAIHLLLVGLGFMGLSLYLFFAPVTRDEKWLGWLAVVTVLSHFSFCFFQTMGRYAYTSMPLLILFAVYGLGVMQRHVEQNRQGINSFKIYTAAFCGLTFALLAINSDQFTHVGESHEVCHVLQAGEVAGRSFDLSGAGLQAAPSKMYVMVDCSGLPSGTASSINSNNLQVRLNGHLLTGPLLPLQCFNGQNYFLFDTMAEHAGYMRAQVQDFRQWRAVAVDAGSNWLVKDGVNEIEVTNNTPGELPIFGDRVGTQPMLLPSPDYFASDRMLVSLISNESRISSLAPALAESVSTNSSYIKVGGAKLDRAVDAQALKDNLRIYLAIPARSDADQMSTTASDSAHLEFDLTPEKFHWFARTKEGIHLNKAVLKGVGAVGYDLDLAQLKENLRHSPAAAGTNKQSESPAQVAVEISGLVRANKRPGRLGVSAALLSKAAVSQGLGQVPDALLIDQPDVWQPFLFSDVVPLYRLGGLTNLDKLSLAFLPCPRLESCYGAGRQCGDFDLKNLQVKVRVLNLADIGGKTLSVY